MQKHIDKDDLIGQLLAAFTLKLDREFDAITSLQDTTSETEKGITTYGPHFTV